MFHQYVTTAFHLGGSEFRILCLYGQNTDTVKILNYIYFNSKNVVLDYRPCEQDCEYCLQSVT